MLWPLVFVVVFATLAIVGAWLARNVPSDDGVENERDDGGTMAGISSLLD